MLVEDDFGRRNLRQRSWCGKGDDEEGSLPYRQLNCETHCQRKVVRLCCRRKFGPTQLAWKEMWEVGTGWAARLNADGLDLCESESRSLCERAR